MQYYISSTKFTIQERKTKKNGTVYDVVFRITTLDGNEKQKKLSGFKTKTLAKEAHTRFITENCELVKNNPIKKKRTDKETPTVGELIAEYITSLGNQNKESTIYDKKHIYDLWVLPKYRNVKITALTKEELYKWQDELWATKNPKTNDFYSWNYLCKVRTQFSAFLGYCESRYDYFNFFNKIKAPKRRTPKTEMKFWTKDEFEQFIKAVDNPKYHCLFTMMFYTGRRMGEIIALSPDDVMGDKIRFNKSFMKKTISSEPWKISSTKEDKSQIIPICKTLQQEINSYEVPEGNFFFNGKTPLSPNALTTAFKKYIRLSGVKEIRVHDIRHSFVSMLIHLGANYNVIADLISDTVEQVIKTYGHLYISDKIDIINKLG